MRTIEVVRVDVERLEIVLDESNRQERAHRLSREVPERFFHWLDREDTTRRPREDRYKAHRRNAQVA